MATDRDIVAEIDDVITWHGSRDAMVWTAEPPKRRYSRLAPVQDYLEAGERLLDSPNFEQVVNAVRTGQPIAVDAERAQQAFARLGEQMQAFAEAFRPLAEGIARNFAAMTRAFNEIVNTPQMRELAHEQRRARSAVKSEYARRRRRRSTR